ncbi:MAG TPA: FAD-dependent oxidoreductase [Thermoanaerobaculia bacterium]|nr:FAD-dependent oxidoreductase [Thermoanaerobaculia bacterium]
MQRIVILGGGYAGSLAAVRLAKRGIAVTLVDANDGLVERVRLHQIMAGDDVVPVPYSKLFRGLPIEFIRARVSRIDRGRRLIETTAGNLQYDRLLYALGSSSAGLTGPAAARNLRERLRTAKSVAVVGAGLTGIESAAEIAERFPETRVTLFDSGTIGADLSEGAARHLRSWMSAHHVAFRENERVQNVDADLVLWCNSFSVSPIGRESGLPVNGRGQILVDDNLRSSDPSIFAVGDAAAFRDLRMGCVSAMPMAAYAADYLAGATDGPFRFGFVINCISLGRHDGIIQFVEADDTPRQRFLSGRPAAWVKELICRFVVSSIRLERIGVHYSWPKTASA